MPTKKLPTHFSRFARLRDVDRPEPSPLSTASCGTNISDYIGSGTSSGGHSPALDGLLEQDYHPDPRDHYNEPQGDKSDDDDDDDDDDSSFDEDDDDDKMGDPRPPLLPSNDGRSGTPLLQKPDDDVEAIGARYDSRAELLGIPARPTFSRRSTMRSSSPGTSVRDTATKKYLYAAFFLMISLVSFTIQTELAAYVQHELGWNKAYCMLYVTHGSWSLLWPVQLGILRLQKRDVPWDTFWRRHVELIRGTAVMVETQDLDAMRPSVQSRANPVWYLIRMTALVTSALTIGGLSWYIAVDLTSPSDLTAIYNCSAFFAYVFSVPLLKEPLRTDKSIAVGVAILGVLVVAYGDAKPQGGRPDPGAGSRFLGNIIIGIGSVLYGLYEVLYKRYACPPEGCSPGRGMIFANTFGSFIGAFTLLVLWVPLPILHFTGVETFELPTGYTALLLLISVLANATFAGSFLVLISLTSPVLSSVAALLTIFIVAVVDWLLMGQPLSAAAVLGGVMIIVAFGMLSWSTWREMAENEDNKGADLTDSGDDSDMDDDDS